MGVELGDLLFWSGAGVFLANADFTLWSERRAFLSGEVNFLLWILWGRGSPLLGENKAIMAEPSDWPAINDGITKKLKG